MSVLLLTASPIICDKVVCDALVKWHLPSYIRKIKISYNNSFVLGLRPSLNAKAVVDVLVQKSDNFQCLWLQHIFFWKRNPDGSEYVSTAKCMGVFHSSSLGSFYSVNPNVYSSRTFTDVCGSLKLDGTIRSISSILEFMYVCVWNYVRQPSSA